MTTCTKCDKVLVPVHGDTNYQFDNALWIGLFGGYGMFVDNIDETLAEQKNILKGSDYELVLCHECAHEFFDNNSWLKGIINPHKSHSHTEEYHQHHPEHYGWDYDKKEQFDRTEALTSLVPEGGYRDEDF